MAETKKILWPIDPRESSKEMDHGVFNFLQKLSRHLPFEVQPVHVTSSSFFATSEYFEAIEISDLRENVYQECLDYLQYFKDYVKKDPIVLDNNYSASHAETSLLADYVKNYEPDFVLLASHGRQGWARHFMGSFTETFLINSQAPVIVVGKNCQKDYDLSKGIMPVEINEGSQTFLEQFLDDHRLSFMSDLTLFHKVSLVDLEDIAWAPSLYGLSGYTSHDIVAKAKETSHAFLKSFLDHPLAQKRLSYQVREKLTPVAEAILDEVKETKQGVIVMRSQVGTLAANLLGSITWDLLRQSPVPVIVYPHDFKRIK